MALVGACSRQVPESPGEPPAPASPAAAATSLRTPAGRPAVRPDFETVTAVTRALGPNASQSTCGPYRLISDAESRDLGAICRRLAIDLDATYEERFGIRPSGPADGVVALFGTAEAFRQLAAETGRLSVGYEAFTLAGRGLTALSVENLPTERLVTVLAHELAHLVHRRAFGGGLDPWLSEGLADAIGDSATTSGFADLVGLVGVEPLAHRLRQAHDAERTEPVAAVLAKTRETFDRETVSYDYETSALLVRYLLLDSELGPRFKKVLAELAVGELCPTECVLETLAVEPEELDRKFRAWLRTFP